MSTFFSFCFVTHDESPPVLEVPLCLFTSIFLFLIGHFARFYLLNVSVSLHFGIFFFIETLVSGYIPILLDHYLFFFIDEVKYAKCLSVFLEEER